MEDDMATKTIKFDDEKEKELLEFLQTLPHGDFSQKTKEYWLRQLELSLNIPKKSRSRNVYDLLKNLGENDTPPTTSDSFLETIKKLVDESVKEQMKERSKRGKNKIDIKEEEIT